jgi:tetratricopeptide (TPR) repeat protein
LAQIALLALALSACATGSKETGADHRTPRRQKNVGDDTPVGDGDAAIQAYREAIRLNPRYAQAHNNIGSILWRRFESEGAIRSFEAALAIDPNLANARQNLEMAKRGRGRFGVGLPE